MNLLVCPRSLYNPQNIVQERNQTLHKKGANRYFLPQNKHHPSKQEASSKVQNDASFLVKRMAGQQLKPAASFLLAVNFAMYVVVLAISGWAMNKAIDHGFIIGAGFELPAHFSPIYFPMGNAATGFFVVFSLIAGVVGVASVISGVNHIQVWRAESLPAAASAAVVAWSLTLLAMGFAWKEIDLHYRNASLRTMEAFVIILSVTQLLYIAAIHGISRI